MGKRESQDIPRDKSAPPLSARRAVNRDLHASVLTSEVVELFAPLGKGLVLDATFGRGGHTRALLEQTSCRIVAIDCDPEAIAYGRTEPFFQTHAARFSLLQGLFGESVNLLARQDSQSPRDLSDGMLDGVLFDYGLSSPQLDKAERGFSFQRQGPLDMRMAGAGESAREFLERVTEEELVQILRTCGERHARRIARALVDAREEGNLPQDTLALAKLVRQQASSPPAARRRISRREDGGRTHTDNATKTFMALRIAINDELEQIARGLRQADHLLRKGGRIITIAFHSLEDRIVKQQFAEWTGRSHTNPSRHHASLQDLQERKSQNNPQGSPSDANDLSRESIRYRALVRRVRRASALEVSANPRARSARLRAVEKLASAQVGATTSPTKARAA